MNDKLKKIVRDVTLVFAILVFLSGISVIIADIGSATYTGIGMINIVGFIFGVICISASLYYMVTQKGCPQL